MATISSAKIVEYANISTEKYEEMYAASVFDPDAFWGEHGKRVDWIRQIPNIRKISMSFQTGHLDDIRRIDPALQIRVQPALALADDVGRKSLALDQIALKLGGAGVGGSSQNINGFIRRFFCKRKNQTPFFF